MKTHIISGGISGAITDTNSDRALQHADTFYEAIRKRTDDVEHIARNTGYPVPVIKRIKDYLFIEEHLLDDVMKKFESCFEIAQSWHRLAYEPECIQPHDLLLLKHEIREMEYVEKGFSQDEAHTIASREFDYSHDSRMFYEELAAKQNKDKD